MSNHVTPPRAIKLVHGLLVRQLLTRGRVIALLILSAFLGVVALAVRLSDTIEDPLASAVDILDLVGFTLVVPIVTLVFAGAALGDPREDGTLVYLWLRPMDRWPVLVGAWLAAVTVSLPLTVIPLVVAALITGVGGGLMAATAMAALVGVLVYSAVFVLLGLLLKNSIIWGIGYILLWEGLIAQFGSALGKAALRGYTRSILANRMDIDLDGFTEFSTSTAVIVPILVTVIALGLSTARLRAMEID